MWQRFSLYFLITLVLPSCTVTSTGQLHKLKNGKTIKIISIGPMFFSKDTPALVMNYQTDIDINKKDILREEAEEIWDEYRFYFENSKLTWGVINAHSKPRGFIISSDISQGFVIEKNSDGSWEFKNHTQ
jgi:hypothetical protein